MSRMAVAALVLCAVGVSACSRPVLKVCDDPNNLPFSNAEGQGFENKIVQLVAARLGRTVRYTWWAQHKGYVRNTLDKDSCDLWPGVATGMDGLAVTAPYYRSTYVFVSRADRGVDVVSFDDPRLKRLKIGIQMIGGDGMHTPPAHALASRGLVDNLEPFLLDADYARPNPPAAIIEAVDKGDIDLAVVWGPTAGYFASRAHHRMRVTPVPPSHQASWPMSFDIAMGVRSGDHALLRAVNQALRERRSEIDTILAAYQVPILPSH
jgi:mxaJ protein